MEDTTPARVVSSIVLCDQYFSLQHLAVLRFFPIARLQWLYEYIRLLKGPYMQSRSYPLRSFRFCYFICRVAMGGQQFSCHDLQML